MATKKKPVSKAGSKSSKPAPKKAAKPAAKAAAKKPAPAKKHAKPVKVASKKPAPKPAKPTPKPVAKKSVPHKVEPKHPVKAPVKVEAKAPVAPTPPPRPMVKKPNPNDPKSLVSIKQAPKPIIKKEPPRPTKMVIPKTTIKSAVKYEPEFTKSVLDTPLYDLSGPSMRYSDSDLTEFREIINKKLDAAKKELAYLQGLITRRDEGGDMDEARYMTMEDGSVSMEREQLSQMASRQITFIDHLEKAIMRIENKTYGVCRVTGKLIEKARLRAVPHATLSIEAKQMMNK